MVPGVEGICVGVMLPVVAAALFPQALFAVTETDPSPLPMVTVAEVVPCPPVIDQPVPVVLQV